MRTFVVLALFSAAALTAGCSLIQKRVALKDCKFSLAGARLKSVSLSGFSMDVLLSVQNPNPVDAVLDRFVGSVKLEGIKVADVSNTFGRTVKARSSATVPITVSVRYSYLKGAANRIMGVINSRRANVGVEGKAYMEFNLPFVGKQSIPYPVKLSRTLKF